mmetsp:Transcript_46887/g.147402  ORF Transcript_46887/g.147402 Transcript_46887/m.147402 type:complete len:249 (-) Transcript_46887:708-1454(-)
MAHCAPARLCARPRDADHVQQAAARPAARHQRGGGRHGRPQAALVGACLFREAGRLDHDAAPQRLYAPAIRQAHLRRDASRLRVGLHARARVPRPPIDRRRHPLHQGPNPRRPPRPDSGRRAARPLRAAAAAARLPRVDSASTWHCGRRIALHRSPTPFPARHTQAGQDAAAGAALSRTHVASHALCRRAARPCWRRREWRLRRRRADARGGAPKRGGGGAGGWHRDDGGHPRGAHSGPDRRRERRRR